MTTPDVARLDLESPRARQALAECTRLLLAWASEDDNASDSNDLGRAALSLAHGAPTLEAQAQEYCSDGC
jgi:hypothetical protein